jgi:hypothetical protein
LVSAVRWVLAVLLAVLAVVVPMAHAVKVAMDNVRQSDVAGKLTLPLLKDGRE